MHGQCDDYLVRCDPTPAGVEALVEQLELADNSLFPLVVEQMRVAGCSPSGNKPMPSPDVPTSPRAWTKYDGRHHLVA